MKLIVLVAGILFWALSSGAADLCTAEALTNTCKAFDPKTQWIDTGKGTFIPNFTAVAADEEAATKNSAKTRDALLALGNDLAMKALRITMKSAQIFDSIPNVSPEFRAATSNNLALIHDAMRDTISLKSVFIYWPPSGPGKFQEVDRATVENYFFTLSIAQKTALAGVATEYDDLQRVANVKTSLSANAQDLTKRMLNFTEDRVDQVDDLTEQAKDAIIEMIKGGRTIAQLSPAEKAAVAKVSAITFTPPSSDQVRLNATCAGMVPNAFYDPLENSMNVCPNFFNFPDATIISVLGHELGHAIDPCNSQFADYKIDQKKVTAAKNDPAVRNDSDQYNLVLTLDGLHKQTAMPAGLMFRKDESATFEERGILKKVSDGIPFSNYVLKDVYHCLTGPEGGQFRAQDKNEITRIADDVVTARKEEGVGSYDAQKDHNAIVDAFNKYPECISPIAHSQMGETIADWIGSQVLGNYLKGKKITSSADRVSTIGFFGNVICADLYERNKRGTQKSSAEVIGSAIDDFEKQLDAHPTSIKRLNEIYLLNPDVRAALGCGPPSAHQPCRHNATSNAAAQTTAPVKGAQ